MSPTGVHCGMGTACGRMCSGLSDYRWDSGVHGRWIAEEAGPSCVNGGRCQIKQAKGASFGHKGNAIVQDAGAEPMLYACHEGVLEVQK